MSLLRGAIEGVTQDAIYGWIYSNAERLRDRLVLAFYNEACIGAGNVGLYREDLMSVGLGDGYLGFHFGIDFPGTDALNGVVVKLEGSDAVLMQRGSRVVGAERSAPGLVTEAELESVLSSLKWQLSNQLLDQPEYDFLRSIWMYGVCERIMRERGQSAGISGSRLNPQEMLERLVAFYVMDEVTAEPPRTLLGDNDFAASLEKLRESTATIPIVGLCSAGRETVKAVEGSHIDGGRPTSPDMRGAVSFAIGPDQITFVDIRCKLSLAATGEVTLFSVRRKGV